jgi:ribosomal protein S18 acetylase RimI-like enzyme
MIRIRRGTDADKDAIWAIIEPILRAGETYALPSRWNRGEALAYWHAPGHSVFVAEAGDDVLGTYFLHPNQMGGGSHVANCGYMTSPRATGRGVARAMCAHSLDYAASQGFTAMQFNFVVATNLRAIDLWTSFGFEIVGTLPGAFRHPKSGIVDALVMFRTL